MLKCDHSGKVPTYAEIDQLRESIESHRGVVRSEWHGLMDLFVGALTKLKETLTGSRNERGHHALVNVCACLSVS